MSKNLDTITDPKQFKGLTIVTSPEPNTNYSVAKRMLETAGLKVGEDVKILEFNPGTEIGAMLAGQADMAIAYQPSVASAVAQGAKVVFDFSNYVGPFCNTGIMVLPSFVEAHPDIVQALVTSFEEASRKTYQDPEFAKEVARKELPICRPTWSARRSMPSSKVQDPRRVGGRQTRPVGQPDGDAGLSGNVKGTMTFDEIIDNSFAEKAMQAAGG